MLTAKTQWRLTKWRHRSRTLKTTKQAT